MATKSVDPNMPSGASADPAAPVNLEGGEEAPRIPQNAQHLGDHHEALRIAHEHNEKNMEAVDNPGVKKVCMKHMGQLKKMLNEANGTFVKEYPHLEPLHEKDFAAAGAARGEEAEDLEEDATEKEKKEDKEEVKKDEKGRLWYRKKDVPGAAPPGTPPAAPAPGLGEEHRETLKAIGEALCEHGEHLKSMCSMKSEEAGMDDMSPEEKSLALSVLGAMKDEREALKKQLAAATGVSTGAA